jgi:hypothetical protein
MFELQTEDTSVAKLFKCGWQLYLLTFKRVFLVSVCSAIVNSLLTWAQQGLGPLAHVSHGAWAFLFIALVSILTVSTAAVLMLHQQYQWAKGALASWEESWRCVRNRILSMIAAMIFVFVLFSLGILLMFLPGIIIAIFLSMTFPLVVFAGQRSTRAIALSCQLVWRRWWRTALLVMSPSIVVVIVLSVAKRLVLPLETQALLEFISLSFISPWIYANLIVMYHYLISTSKLTLKSK